MLLNDVFEEFRNCKVIFEKIYKDMIKCFDEIEGKLFSFWDEEIIVELMVVSFLFVELILEEIVCIGDVCFEVDLWLLELFYIIKEKKEVVVFFLEEFVLIFVG